MARYQITGPDGANYEITAPDGAAEKDVMDYFQANNGKGRPEQVLSAGDTAVDVAKSAGIGLAQGTIGLATLPGNVEALARTGVDAGARLAGIEDPKLSDNTFLPTYTDWKKRVEGVTGDFYEPKTRAGNYARTVGEFAPLALGGPASLGVRAARVLAPAAASETAGQMTAGTRLEPWARIAGAMIGGRAPMPGAAPRLARDPQYAAAVQRLDQEGVNAMTAAQRTGNVPMRWIEDATATVPGGGGRAVQMQEQAAQQFTAAALRRAGVNADRATPETLAPAFDALGQEFNQFAGAHNVVPTNAARTRLAAIARDYEQLTPEALRVPYIRQLVDDLAARPYVVGTDYAGIRSSLRRAQRGLKDNPQASYAMGQIVDTMDVALARSAPAGQRGAVLANLHDMNGRYRNLLAIEDAAGRAGEATARGMISPAALKQAVQKQNKRDYTRGRSELGQLARAGETVLKPLRSSGTGERTMAQGYLSAPGAIAGVLAQGGIEGALVGVAAPALAKAGAARAVMSRAGQAMVQNERIMEPMAYDGAAARLAALLAMQPEKERGLRGGTGPRYDALYNNK